MGGKLGTLFARVGHEVVFSYSGTKGKLERLAREAGGNARSGTPVEAAQGADVVLLAVHWSRIDDVVQQSGDLAGKVVISCSLPLDADNTELILGHTTSGAEALARKLPGSEVVSAFNNIPSEVLFGVFAARGKGNPPSMLYCGDSEPAKVIVAELIREVGLDPLDVGPLSAARHTEPLAMIIAHLAYERGEGPEVAYRFERFEPMG